MRSALSLIETIVVIAILAILAAIILPAVQTARESSRRTQCSSNLKQISIAIHSFEGQHGSFPLGNAESYSFLTQILPFVEQRSTLEKIQSLQVMWTDLPSELFQVRVATYQCPSDEISTQRISVTNYAGNLGYDILTKGASGIFHPFSPDFSGPVWQGFPIRVASVTDGLSQTALAGELLVGDGGTGRAAPLRRTWLTVQSFAAGEHDQFVQACLNREFQINAQGEAIGVSVRGTPWLAGSAGRTLYTHCITPNKLSCSNGSSVPFGAYTLASNHPRGVMGAFADGHVRFIADTIETRAWRALGTRAGGEAQQ